MSFAEEQLLVCFLGSLLTDLDLGIWGFPAICSWRCFPRWAWQGGGLAAARMMGPSAFLTSFDASLLSRIVAQLGLEISFLFL